MATELAPARSPAMRFIFVTMLLDVIGFGIVIPISPGLVTQLAGGDVSSGATWVGVMVALYTLMQFLCAPLLGALSDRYGRRPVLLLSLVLAASSYLGAAVAPTLGWLLAARAVGGVGAASLSVASTYIADVTPPAERAQAFGMLGAAFGLGFIAGPAIGGIAGAYDLRLPFILAGLVAATNALYGLIVLPESHLPENRRPFSWAAANPVAWVALLRRYPLVVGLAGGMIWSGLAMQCLHTNWVVYTTYKFAWTPTETGWSLALVGLGAAVVQGWLIRKILPWLAGTGSPARGERRAIAFGLAIQAVAMVLYGLATQTWMMYVILIAGSLGGIAGPAMQAQVSKQVSPAEQGAVQGALASLMSATGIVGPLVANGLFSFFTSPAAPFQLPGVAFFLGATMFAIALVVTWRVFQRLPEAT